MKGQAHVALQGLLVSQFSCHGLLPLVAWGWQAQPVERGQPLFLAQTWLLFGGVCALELSLSAALLCKGCTSLFLALGGSTCPVPSSSLLFRKSR